VLQYLGNSVLLFGNDQLLFTATFYFNEVSFWRLSNNPIR